MTTNDDTAKHARSGASAAERDLDRMLDMLVPPAPSDTLRARLKRDFALPGGAQKSAAGGSRRPFGAFEGRVGGLAVAAALVLAIGLGVLVPAAPRPQGAMTAAVDTMAAETGAVAASLYDQDLTEDAALSAALADSAPDSAAFMVATFDASTRMTLASTSYGSEFVGLMPLD